MHTVKRSSYYQKVQQPTRPSLICQPVTSLGSPPTSLPSSLQSSLTGLLKAPGPLPPQGLCTCCSRCWVCPVPRSPRASLFCFLHHLT